MTCRAFSPKSVLVDSGATLALANRNVRNHASAVRIHRDLIAARTRLFSTNYLVDETYTLTLARMGYRFAMQFLDDVEAGSITVVRLMAADENQAVRLLRQYDDKRFSYTDATSFAVIERLRIEAAFTFDKNFVEFGRVVVLTS